MDDKNVTKFFGEEKEENLVSFRIGRTPGYDHILREFMDYNYFKELPECIKEYNLKTEKYIFTENEIISVDEILTYLEGESKTFLVRKPITKINRNIMAKVSIFDKKQKKIIATKMMEFKLRSEKGISYIEDRKLGKEYFLIGEKFSEYTFVDARKLYDPVFSKYWKQLWEDKKTYKTKNFIDLIVREHLIGTTEKYYDSERLMELFCDKIRYSQFLFKDKMEIYYYSALPVMIVFKGFSTSAVKYNLLTGECTLEDKYFLEDEYVFNHKDFLSEIHKSLPELRNSSKKWKRVVMDFNDESEIYNKLSRVSMGQIINVRNAEQFKHIIFGLNIDIDFDELQKYFDLNSLKYPVRISADPSIENTVLYVLEKNYDDYPNEYILALNNFEDCLQPQK